MEKWGALISRLQQQYSQQAEESVLLNTALMLVAELQKNKADAPISTGKVSVILPYKPFETSAITNNVAEEETQNENTEQNVAEPIEPIFAEKEEPIVETEPVQEVNPVTESAQTSAINTLAEEKYNDVLEQVPTLVQQEPKVFFELNDTAQTDEPSINDKLKPKVTETVAKIQGEPIKDLRRAIGINDKYLFMKELFRNDETAYERSIKTINSFNILPEAEYWIQREMKYKLGWDDNNPTVQAFYQLVKRRFA